MSEDGYADDIVKLDQLHFTLGQLLGTHHLGAALAEMVPQPLVDHPSRGLCPVGARLENASGVQ